VSERLRFSERYRTRVSTNLAYDTLPERVPAGLTNVLEGIASRSTRRRSLISGYVRLVCSEIDSPLPYATVTVNGVPEHDEHQLLEVLSGVEWDAACDVCEVIYDSMASHDQGVFQASVNRVFARNRFGYEMREGRVERVGAITQDLAIEEARGILKDPDLAGPNEQFRKAVQFYSQRPLPDCENAVKDAVGAVEGLARVLFEDPSLLLSKFGNRLRESKGTHPALVQTIEKLNAYRGDAEGVGHGNAGIRAVPLEEAEYVLGVSASAIVYLARVFGRGVS
jgi:hypothetical protein